MTCAYAIQMATGDHMASTCLVNASKLARVRKNFSTIASDMRLRFRPIYKLVAGSCSISLSSNNAFILLTRGRRLRGSIQEKPLSSCQVAWNPYLYL